jgi:predicted SAM-dependent methyltransferase
VLLKNKKQAMHNKQVDKSHYEFNKYCDKKRWVSIWHQLNEVISLRPTSVLELGPGPGLFKKLAKHIGIMVETVDIDPELKPDFLASVLELPFDDNSCDCVCAFQMLEHLPYGESIQTFNEMVRVAKRNVIISLPDSKLHLILSIDPYMLSTKIDLKQKTFHIPIPRLKKVKKEPTGEHFWEINKKGINLKDIINDFSNEKACLIKTYRVDENPRHRFFIFKMKL